MERDARRMRGERPFVLTNLKTGAGARRGDRFIERRGLLETALSPASAPG